jgi:hypothetical protein
MKWSMSSVVVLVAGVWFVAFGAQAGATMANGDKMGMMDTNCTGCIEAASVQLGRTAATGASDAQCASLCPILTCPGRLACVAVERSPDSRSPPLGAGHCAPTREEYCGGRLSPPPRAHLVRDVARRRAV